MKRLFIGLVLASMAALSCKGPSSQWDEAERWYASSSAIDPEKTDVLYLVSTEVLSAMDADGTVYWQSQLTDNDRAAIDAELAWVEQNMFYEDFNFIAPYYHQFTFDALKELDAAQFEQVYRQVADEACAAFDHYMKHVNGGREFILAGFSQGAMLTVDLLKHMTDEQFSRMAACYTIGYRLSEEDLQHPHIQAAAEESDRGVVISFNSSLTREAIWPFVSEGSATSINPINWKADSTAASFEFEGTTNSVHIDPETNVLLVDTDSPEFYHSFYDAAGFFLDAGVSVDNLHHWDLLFYPRYIHDNAVLRAGSIVNGN